MIGLSLAAILAFIIGCGIGWKQSNRRYAETVEKEISSRQAFLSLSAHQLRTPLHQIVGVLQVLDLQKAALTDKQRELVEILNEGTQNLSGALIDILDILDIDSKKLKIEKSRTNLKKTLETLERRFKNRAEKKGVKVLFDIKALERNWFLVDEVRVMQCVSSMLTQCLNQTEKGAVRLTSSLERSKEAGVGKLVIVVHDNSPGMEQSATEAYFNPEKYNINPYMTNAEGRRLALMLARMLARRMRGDMTVQAATGQGVMFCFTIPVKYGAATGKGNRVMDSPVIDRARLLLAGKTILAVDDNAANLTVVRSFLEEGHVGKILTAVNGVEAIKVVENNHCDLILMDVQMPEMDGVTATKHIRNSDKPFKNIPIVALTAAAGMDNEEVYKRAGMNSMLAKPVNIEDLFETIERALIDASKRRAA